MEYADDSGSFFVKRIVTETDDAFLFEVELVVENTTEEVWMPKSQVTYGAELEHGGKGDGTYPVGEWRAPNWLLANKGLA